MSHRITTKSAMTDQSIINESLAAKGWKCSVKGTLVTITTGPMAHAVIDTKTGTVRGDSDMHDKKILSELNQTYLELLTVREVEQQGGEILERSVENGTIRLLIRANMA